VLPFHESLYATVALTAPARGSGDGHAGSLAVHVKPLRPGKLLAKEVVEEFGGRAKFVVEDLGASPIAERFGVGAYPAIFVDQALVARPEDFYEWGGPKTGKYIPWTDLANRRRFQEELRTLIGLRLEGADVPSLEITKGAARAKTLPDVAMTALDGRR